MIAICEQCSKEHTTIPSWYKRSKHHYCSRVCSLEASIERRRKQILEVGAKTRFKPGDKPSQNRKMQKGKEHYAWKGQEVGYRGLHYWLRRIKGIPETCTQCSSIKSVQWANVDGQYRRDPEDYIAMCASCHKIHDINLKSIRGAPSAIQ